MSNDLVGRLVAATDEDRDVAGVVLLGTYQPVGGPGGRIMPPTFPDGKDTRYLTTERKLADGDAVEDVLVDQVPSQANRIEESLLDSSKSGRVVLPMFAVTAETSLGDVTLTSLDFPHRYADAYLRDSLVDGVAFDKTDYGKALRAASSADARALYQREPYSLLFGAWDSHRKGRKQKFPRTYSSEMFGLDWRPLPRAAGRKDPLNLTGAVKNSGDDWDWQRPGEEKKKGSKLSEIGHGHIAPNAAPGGGVVERVVRRAWISMAGLGRIRFGDASAEAAHMARAALAALALAGDRLAFGAPSVWLRSGCDLTKVEERIGLERAGGEVEPFDVTIEAALEAFVELRDRAAAAGLAMADDIVDVTPSTAVAKAIEYAMSKAAEDEED